MHEVLRLESLARPFEVPGLKLQSIPTALLLLATSHQHQSMCIVDTWRTLGPNYLLQRLFSPFQNGSIFLKFVAQYIKGNLHFGMAGSICKLESN
jgi:hypothetical protein